MRISFCSDPIAWFSWRIAYRFVLLTIHALFSSLSVCSSVRIHGSQRSFIHYFSFQFIFPFKGAQKWTKFTSFFPFFHFISRCARSSFFRRKSTRPQHTYTQTQVHTYTHTWSMKSLICWKMFNKFSKFSISFIINHLFSFILLALLLKIHWKPSIYWQWRGNLNLFTIERFNLEIGLSKLVLAHD